MIRNKFLFMTMSGLLLMLPTLASAHEHQTFMIGGKTYVLGVGSLNEPVAVDDKSGVELSVTRMEAGAAHSDDPDEGGTPVTGLESTLKVEVSAGQAKKTLDLSPVYGEEGSYKAVFFPTVQTTFTYRFFGTIEGTAVSLSFTCNPAGHAKSEDWTGSETLSEGVVRTAKSGAFGCPTGKAELGFPEPSASLLQVQDAKSGGVNWGIVGTALGALGVALGLAARRKSRT
jgi:hypothetical protein